MSSDGLGYWPNITPPIITQPVASLINAVLGMTLSSTGFASATDTLASTQYEVRTAANGAGSLVYSTAGSLVPALTMGLGQTYYVRARFVGSTGYTSPFSADVVITT